MELMLIESRSADRVMTTNQIQVLHENVASMGAILKRLQNDFDLLRQDVIDLALKNKNNEDNDINYYPEFKDDNQLLFSAISYGISSLRERVTAVEYKVFEKVEEPTKLSLVEEIEETIDVDIDHVDDIDVAKTASLSEIVIS